MWIFKYTQTYAWAINVHVHTCRCIKVHKLTSAYPCDICIHAYVQDSGFCGSSLILIPMLRKCGVHSQMVETPEEIVAPYLPAKSQNQALSFSMPKMVASKDFYSC